MRFTIHSLWIGLLVLLGANNAFAQGGEGKKDARKGGHWFLGLNAGVAWNQSDVDTRLGGGTGFYVGKNILYSKFVSLDIRGRYLWTQTYGLDGERSLLDTSANASYTDRLLLGKIAGGANYNFTDVTNPYVYHNYRTNFHDLALEARVNFEFLKPFWLSIYGGADLGIYKAKLDQSTPFDFTPEYEYNDVFNQATSKPEARDLINQQRDFDYETIAQDNKYAGWRAGFMPDVGIEVGWWITPRFGIGVGHRVNFTLTDKFDGVLEDNGQPLNSAIHHYTHLNLHWRFMGKEDYIQWGGNVRGNDNNNIVNNGNNNPPCVAPVVSFTTPSATSSTVASTPTTIRAVLSNIKESSGILMTINGSASRNFTFSASTGELIANITLVQGNNSITIKGQNACGADSKTISINYQTIAPDPNNNTNPCATPTLVITSPANGASFNSPNVTIQAQTSNATRVEYWLNGALANNYNYNASSGSFSSSTTLLQGTNTLMIHAFNSCDMRVTQTLTLVYQTGNNNNPPLVPPVVTITNPGQNPFTTNSSPATIQATITNVSSPSNVSFVVNGNANNTFTLNGTNFTASGIGLNPGNNTFTITATNAAGMDSESTTIIYNQPQNTVRNPPVVTITNPSQDPFNTTVSTANIVATVLNVPTRSGVSFTVNGVNNNNFSFSGTTFSASNIPLNQGNNTFVVTGTNNDGSASDNTTIIYTQPCQAPTLFVSAPGNNSTTNQATAQVVARLTNVNDRNMIRFTVNGSNANFNYNASTGEFTASVNLVRGYNTLSISVNNNCGTASQTATVTYQPAATPPVVTITNPSQDPFNTTSNTATINATILNVPTRTGVTFAVNGSLNNNFSFSGTNFTASNVSLVQGANTFTITGTNGDGSASDNTTIIYTVPCNPPTLNVSSPAANATVTTNTANVQAQFTNISSMNQITFNVNGVATRNFSYNPQTGSFSATISLTAGSNSLNIFASNDCGQVNQSANVTYNLPCQQPTLTISSPAANSTVSSNTANVQAYFTQISNAGQISFTVNGASSSNFNFNAQSGLFTATVNLVQGNNSLSISAKNDCGRVSQSANINYQPQLNPPTVNITNPSQNPFNTTTSTATINATITNVPTRNNVTFTVNGASNNGFSFSGTNFTATNVPLVQGNNVVVITGTNNDGTASDQTTIVYTVPCQQPTLTVTSPAANSTVSSNTANVQAQFSQVTAASQITFMVNGVSNNNFNFNPQTGIFSATVTLAQGNNTLTLAAKNNCGQISQSANINYQPQANPPTVNITNPSQNPFNTTTSTATINATITNVPTRNNVTFTVNGASNSGFSFSGTNFTATNVPLVQGNNVVVITGTNNDGTASDQTTIVYTVPCQQPTLTVTSPAANATVSTNTANVQAKFTNIAAANLISFMVNGVSNNNFNYNPQTGIFSATVTLKEGSNTLTLAAKNDCGNVNQSANISYIKPVEIVTPPTVNITNPSANPFTSITNTTNINATITGVGNIRDVRFQVNGSNNSNFTLNGTSFTATNVPLNSGNNTIVITATNGGGTASDQTTIVYTVPCQQPTLTVTSPAANATVSTNTANVQAKFTNIAAANLISFMVNGVSNNNFNYNPQTGIFSATVTLKEGSNTLTLAAKNDCGNVNQSANISYIKPVEIVTPPTVNITNPSANPFTSITNTTNINATITGVGNIRDVRFQVNGSNNSNFTLNGTSFTATNVPLNSGNNTIVITATNGGGTASDQTTIVYQNQPAPTVQIVRPAEDPLTVLNNSALLTMMATTTNVTSTNQISVTCNGVAYTSFSFSNGTISAPSIPINVGSNTITVRVTTTGGTATDNTVVIRQDAAPNNGSNGNNGTNNRPVENNGGSNNSTTGNSERTGATAKPTVTVNSPRNSASLSSAATTLSATVSGVTAAKDVTVTLNGTAVSGVSLSGTTVTAPLTLKEGSNTIVITVKNSAGTASQTITASYVRSTGINNGRGG